MKHLEMSQQNLSEWVRKASLADSVLVTTFLPGFITETIQKTRTIAGRRGAQRGGEKMRLDGKIKSLFRKLGIICFLLLHSYMKLAFLR